MRSLSLVPLVGGVLPFFLSSVVHSKPAPSAASIRGGGMEFVDGPLSANNLGVSTSNDLIYSTLATLPPTVAPSVFVNGGSGIGSLGSLDDQPGQSQSIPGQSGQPGQIVPGQPGQSGQSVPGGDVLGQSQSVPGQPGQVVPGQPGQVIPGQSGQQGQPGQPGQVVPGQTIAVQGSSGGSVTIPGITVPGFTISGITTVAGVTMPAQTLPAQSAGSSPGQNSPGQVLSQSPGSSTSSGQSSRSTQATQNGQLATNNFKNGAGRPTQALRTGVYGAYVLYKMCSMFAL